MPWRLAYMNLQTLRSSKGSRHDPHLSRTSCSDPVLHLHPRCNKKLADEISLLSVPRFRRMESPSKSLSNIWPLVGNVPCYPYWTTKLDRFVANALVTPQDQFSLVYAYPALPDFSLLTLRDRGGHSGGPRCTKLAQEDMLLRHTPALVDPSGLFIPPAPRASVPSCFSLTDFNSRGLSDTVIPTLLKSWKCHKLPLHLEGLFCLLQVEELSS